MAQGRRSTRRALLIAVAAAVIYGLQWYTGADLGLGIGSEGPRGTTDTRREPPREGPGRDDSARIAELFRDERSGVVVEAEGVVARVLRDDREGSKHQRFVIDLGSGTSVLIAHNIDLAPRAPVRAGDAVRFRGQYEWNDRGGVVHWTHHDPDGRRRGGWLEHEGRRYE